MYFISLDNTKCLAEFALLYIEDNSQHFSEFYASTFYASNPLTQPTDFPRILSAFCTKTFCPTFFQLCTQHPTIINKEKQKPNFQKLIAQARSLTKLRRNLSSTIFKKNERKVFAQTVLNKRTKTNKSKNKTKSLGNLLNLFIFFSI